MYFVMVVQELYPILCTLLRVLKMKFDLGGRKVLSILDHLFPILHTGRGLDTKSWEKFVEDTVLALLNLLCSQPELHDPALQTLTKIILLLGFNNTNLALIIIRKLPNVNEQNFQVFMEALSSAERKGLPVRQFLKDVVGIKIGQDLLTKESNIHQLPDDTLQKRNNFRKSLHKKRPEEVVKN